MTAIVYDPCNSLDDKTLNQTTGVVQISSPLGTNTTNAIEQTDGGVGGSNQWSYTNATRIRNGNIIYCQMYKAGITENHYFAISKGPGLTGSTTAKIYRGTNNRVWLRDGNTNRYLVSVAATWMDFKIEIVGGVLRASQRVSDSPGNFDPNSSAWTLMGDSITITGFDDIDVWLTGTFFAGLGTCGNDEIYITTDGDISLPVTSGRSSMSKLIRMGQA